MYGSHLSIAGGMHNALIKARELGMDCVQVFTKNQRQWRVKPLDAEAVTQWLDHRQSTGIKEVVSHDSYLINLASPDDALRNKSIGLFEHELTRCQQLQIPWLVMHPGAHMGQGVERGLSRVARAFDQLHETVGDLDVTTCLEITAGQGTSLGHEFEHLQAIIEQVREPDRLGVCLDTAHMLAAGYDLTSEKGMRATLRTISRTVGLSRVKVIHVNDSKVPRGARVDRHEHIGHGHVSLDAFAVLVNHRTLGRLPMILETAKEDAPDGRPWDTVNLETLKQLKSRATTKLPRGRRTDRRPSPKPKK